MYQYLYGYVNWFYRYRCRGPEVGAVEASAATALAVGAVSAVAWRIEVGKTYYCSLFITSPFSYDENYNNTAFLSFWLMKNLKRVIVKMDISMAWPICKRDFLQTKRCSSYHLGFKRKCLQELKTIDICLRGVLYFIIANFTSNGKSMAWPICNIKY